MRLYELSKRRIKVRLIQPESGPPASIDPQVGEVYLFDHIDGMYSYCKDSDGNVVHLPAWSEVEVVE